MFFFLFFFDRESTERPRKYYQTRITTGLTYLGVEVFVGVIYLKLDPRTKDSFEMVKIPAGDRPLDLQRHVEAEIVAVVVVASEGFILVLVNHQSRGACRLGRGCCSSASWITLLELCCCCWGRRWNHWLMCSWACYHWYNSRRVPVVSTF